MSRRDPVIPSAGVLMLVAVGTVVPMVAATRMWAQTTTVDPLGWVAWTGLMLVAFGSLLATRPILKGLQARGLLSNSRWRKWIWYYGLFVAAGMVSAALQVATSWGVLGRPSSALQVAVQLLFSGWLMGMLAFFGERYCAFQQGLEDQIERSRESIRQIFRSREALFEAQERQRRELVSRLSLGIGPRLESLQARLHALQAGGDGTTGGPAAEFADLLDQLDTLRDDEVRQLDRLLHPSVIDVALLPALRTLTGHYGRLFRVQLEASSSLEEADHPIDNRLPPSVRLLVYRIVEQALDNVLRHSRAPRVRVTLAAATDRLILEVEHDGTGLDRAEKGPDFALIDSRIGLAGGTWSVDSVSGGTRLRAEVPCGGRKARC